MKTVIVFILLVSIQAQAHAETKRECEERISKDIANEQIACFDKGYSCCPTKKELCDRLKKCEVVKRDKNGQKSNKVFKKANID